MKFRMIKLISNVFIFLALFALGVSVVHFRHINRQAFANLKLLENQQDELYSVWTQYMLEEATLANHSSIESISHRELQMHFPRDNQILYSSQYEKKFK